MPLTCSGVLLIAPSPVPVSRYIQARLNWCTLALVIFVSVLKRRPV